MKTKLLTLVGALVALAASGQQAASYTDAEAAKHVGEEATVTGKVFNVSTSGKGTTFLNFGDRYPRHTFGGVVFAGSQAVVGDMKQYEGKEVSLTGRIELAPDQKPQIIIKRADQIKLAGATPPPAPAPAAPAPAVASVPAPAATAPMTTAPARPAASPAAASSTPPTESRMKNIELPTGWSSPRRGGDGVRKDLAKLFGGSGTADETTLVNAALEIYPGVDFLTPVEAVKKTLNLTGLQSSKAQVSTPGFPQDAFDAHVFSGVFPGGYNRLLLLTDTSDQVVSIMLVDSSPKSRVQNEPDTTGYHTYNFVTGGARATDNLTIRHTIAPRAQTPGVVVVDTLLIDPTDPEDQPPGRTTKSRTSIYSRQKTGKVLERTRWYVPAPIVNLILRCVGG